MHNAQAFYVIINFFFWLTLVYKYVYEIYPNICLLYKKELINPQIKN